MPEVDNEYFKRQLNNLGLDNEEAIEQCVEVATVGDYEDQEWRPPQDWKYLSRPEFKIFKIIQIYYER